MLGPTLNIAALLGTTPLHELDPPRTRLLALGPNTFSPEIFLIHFVPEGGVVKG